jgi:elongation factor Ts
MANFTIADIKALREQLGTGMVDTKKALEEADGDLEKAVEILRLKGAKGNAKRRPLHQRGPRRRRPQRRQGHHPRAEHRDRLRRQERALHRSRRPGARGRRRRADSVEAALAADAEGKTVAELISDEAAIIGEKVELRRVRTIAGDKFEIYLHKTSKDLPPQVGVVLAYTGDDAETARSIAQHISFANPTYLSREDVPAEEVEKEREIVTEISATRASRRRRCRRSSKAA